MAKINRNQKRKKKTKRKREGDEKNVKAKSFIKQ